MKDHHERQSHTIELAWTAGSPGVASLAIDGANVASVSNLANQTLRLDTARLGPSAGATSSTRGTEYFDAFTSTRVTAIGPP